MIGVVTTPSPLVDGVVTTFQSSGVANIFGDKPEFITLVNASPNGLAVRKTQFGEVFGGLIHFASF